MATASDIATFKFTFAPGDSGAIAGDCNGAPVRDGGVAEVDARAAYHILQDVPGVGAAESLLATAGDATDKSRAAAILVEYAAGEDFNPDSQNADRLILRALDTNFDHTGTTVATGNYAGAPVEFGVAPPYGERYVITRLIVSVKDSGSIDADKYGNGVTLTNGIIVAVKRGAAVIVSLTNGDPVHTNAEWAEKCYDADISDYGAGDNFLHARWTFAKTGRPVVLDGELGDRLVVILNDDFTGLTGHRFTVNGYREYMTAP